MNNSMNTSKTITRLLWVMVWRDLRMIARRKRTFVLRVLFAGGLVLAAFLVWRNMKSNLGHFRKGLLSDW